MLALAAALALLVACSGDDAADPGPRIIQPGAPGEPNVVLDEMPEIEIPEATEDDVAFVHAMIAHHTQALEMARLVPDRTSRDDVPLFAERIELSQDDEIEYMLRWLDERDLPAPPADAHHGHDGTMPGMLTDDQLAELAATEGEAFDRLFLELMYLHHQGALQMVQELLDSGNGNEPVLWRLVNHIDSDQRIELDRIDLMLADLDASGSG